MSQIRLAETIVNDPRFKDLVTLLAEEIDTITRDEAEELALGKCARAFWLAQRYWRDDRKLIPLDVWQLRSNRSFASLLVRVGLAVESEGGVYVRGARDFFDWYHDKSEAGRLGGLKSAEAREARKKRGNPQLAKQTKQTAEAAPADEPSNQPVSVSSSVSVSVSSSVSKLSTPDSGGTPPRGPQPTVFDRGTAEEWARFAQTVSLTLKPKLEHWSHAIRLLREQDGLSERDITETLAFIQSDPFWRQNALSPVAVRGRSKNGLTKLENIRLRMEQDSRQRSGARRPRGFERDTNPDDELAAIEARVLSQFPEPGKEGA